MLHQELEGLIRKLMLRFMQVRCVTDTADVLMTQRSIWKSSLVLIPCSILKMKYLFPPLMRIHFVKHVWLGGTWLYGKPSKGYHWDTHFFVTYTSFNQGYNNMISCLRCLL